MGIIAFPIGLLMIAGELDISIGSMILASSMTIAIISGHYDGPIWLGILAALALGALVGVINGVLVVRTAVPSFIVTLGTLFAVAGLTLGLSVLLTGTTSVAIKAAQRPSFFWATSSAAAIRSPSCGGWLLLPCFGSSCTIPNTATGYGNWIFAMGGDKVSARNEGIPTERLTIILFMCSGVSAAFVGLSQAILYNSAQVSAGQSFIFNAIIAMVVGGVLLIGGYGSVVSIFLGTLTFAIVNQAIYHTPFDSNWASLTFGVLLRLAVLMNNTFRKMASSYSAKGRAKS